MSQKRQGEQTRKTRGSKAGGTEEVPPVVIKGGSLEVRFPDVDFDDADNRTKVKKVTHPDPNIKILRVEIHDNRAGQNDKPLSLYDATDVGGGIDIMIFAK